MPFVLLICAVQVFFNVKDFKMHQFERTLNSPKNNIVLSFSRLAFLLVLLMALLGMTQARLNDVTPPQNATENNVVQEQGHRILAMDSCPSEFKCRAGFFKHIEGRYLYTERWTGLFPAVLTCEAQCFAKFLVPYLVANNVWTCGVCG